jgi:2-hydroxy-3-keto-5-methylthiopentenyl-1-phosphate phosphatase
VKRNELKSIIVYCDFDGTIVTKDIGDELFIHFGDFETNNNNLREGSISIVEYWINLFRTLKPGITPKEISDYALTFSIDAYFKSFTEFCSENNIRLNILSDGFDAYIIPILNSLGLENIKVFCNKMIFSGDSDVPVPYFTGRSESCSCFCASCKRNTILTNTPDDSIIIFIGDGYSDFCAAEHSDIVFAKKHLAAYCNSSHIPHYTYKSFFDIISVLKKIINTPKLKFRHHAQILRKQAFETE